MINPPNEDPKQPPDPNQTEPRKPEPSPIPGRPDPDKDPAKQPGGEERPH